MGSSFTNVNPRTRSALANPDFEDLLDAERLGQEASSALALYSSLVLEANRRLNITGARSIEAITGHIKDSLTLLPYVRAPYVDVGSGAGFPAIPLAIAAGIPVTLVESTLKKARVLEDFLEALGLHGEVLAERAESAGHRTELRERFATGTCRAVASAPGAAELLLPLIAVGGAALLQRGAMDDRERTALEDAALVLGATIEAEHSIGKGRRIAVIRKLSPTPARFPRRTGSAQKRPLCS